MATIAQSDRDRTASSATFEKHAFDDAALAQTSRPPCREAPCGLGDARHDRIQVADDVMVRSPHHMPTELVQRAIARNIVTRAVLVQRSFRDAPRTYGRIAFLRGTEGARTKLGARPCRPTPEWFGAHLSRPGYRGLASWFVDRPPPLELPLQARGHAPSLSARVMTAPV